MREKAARYEEIIEDMAMSEQEWIEIIELTREIDAYACKMRDLFDPIKNQLGIIEVMIINALRTCTKHHYVKDVQYHEVPIHSVENTIASFFTVNEPETVRLLEFTVRLFNHDDDEARQTGEVDVEVTAKQVATLCRFLEPLLMNPTVMHVVEPPVLRQIREACERLKRNLRYVDDVVKADFFKSELTRAKEGLERMLANEEFAKQKEIKLKTVFGNKREYDFLIALRSRLTFRE